ncbi:MAG: hypothetical protein ACTHJS_15400 [Xanthobacteraceae bacterium]
MAKPVKFLSQITKPPEIRLHIKGRKSARTFSDKSEPIPFGCPSCGAKYIIVTVQVPKDGQHNKFGCVKCDALFPAGEGRVSLEYVLVQQTGADVRS